MKNAPFRILSPIHKAGRQIQLFMEAKCRLLGVSTLEAHLLGYCLQFGPCQISELHRVLGEKRSTLTSMLDRLERAGLLSRKLDQQDRRSWLVLLSPKGKRLALKLRGLYQEFEDAVLRRVDAADLAKFEMVIKAISDVTNIEVRSSRRSQSPREPKRKR